MQSPRQKLLSLIVVPAAFLAGCNSTPTERDFLANAEKQLDEREATVCLQLPTSRDYTSITGGLQRGWVAVLDAPPQEVPGMAHQRRLELPVLNALVEAGLAEKDPYPLYKAGELTPATRYKLTAEGRKTVDSSRSCLPVGRWEATRLVIPRTGVQSDVQAPELIQKKIEGALVSYRTHVAFTLKDAPAWATSPTIVAAYPAHLAQVQAGKVLPVELVHFNKNWVSKQVLARTLTSETTPGAINGTRGPAVPIPDDLFAVALAKLNAQARTQPHGRVLLPLPIRGGSETPTGFGAANPGAVFMAVTPDPQVVMREAAKMSERHLAVREKAANDSSVPLEMRTSVLEQVAQERARLKAEKLSKSPTNATAAASDRFLNVRQELKALLDALVEVGAYQKRDVKKDDVAGAEQDGVLYTPMPGTQFRHEAVQLGTLNYTRVVKQQVEHGMLQVTVQVEVLEQPAWLADLVKKFPELAVGQQATRTVTAQPTSNPEFPYQFYGR